MRVPEPSKFALVSCESVSVMIRLKQKKADEEKKAAEEKKTDVEASATPVGIPASSSSAADLKTNLVDGPADASTGGGGLKLLGIGGKGARTGVVTKSAGKKRTPGEIRIQKGARLSRACHVFPFQ